MAIRLKVFNCKYDIKGEHIDDTWFSGNISDCTLIFRKSFRSYVAMADFLDRNKKKFKDKIMYANHNKVVFDGVETWVEDRGSI